MFRYAAIIAAGCGLFSLLSVSAAASESGSPTDTRRDALPLGHPNFYPSPSRPIGWRGDGNGAFPGATLCDSFTLGPVTEIQAPGKKGKKGRWKIVDQGAGQEKNIAWKFHLPGFSMSQPLIVGHKAIITCEPRTVLCLDMNDGREIWRQELCPFMMIGLEGEEREKGLMFESLAFVDLGIIADLGGNYGRIGKPDSPETRQWLQDHLDFLEYAAKKAAAYLPTESARCIAELDKYRTLLAQKEALNKDQIQSFIAVGGKLKEKFRAAYKFDANRHWYGYIGWAYPTPVCDGTSVYISMGQGQLARLKLEDGSIDWFVKVGDVTKGPQPLTRSPVLQDNVLMVPYYRAVCGFDATTGARLYTTSLDSMGCWSAINPVVMTLESGKKVLAVQGNAKTKDCKTMPANELRAIKILDIKTGEWLGMYKTTLGHHDPGPSLMASGPYVVSPYSGLILKLVEGESGITFEEIYGNDDPLKKLGCHAQIVMDGTYYFSDKKMDIATGKLLPLAEGLTKHSKHFSLESWKPGLLIGDRVLGTKIHRLQRYGMTKIEDDKFYSTCVQFFIHDLDGRLVSSDNYMQLMSEEDGIDTVPQTRRFYTDRFRPSLICDINGGLPDRPFGWGGMYAHGNRLLIPSIKYLFCVGDTTMPFNGKPGPTD